MTRLTSTLLLFPQAISELKGMRRLRKQAELQRIELKAKFDSGQVKEVELEERVRKAEAEQKVGSVCHNNNEHMTPQIWFKCSKCSCVLFQLYISCSVTLTWLLHACTSFYAPCVV